MRVREKGCCRDISRIHRGRLPLMLIEHIFISTLKFQFKIMSEDLEGELNFQGDQGWELASSFTKDLDNNGKKEVVLIFKRPLS